MYVLYIIFDIPVYVFQTFHVQKAWAALNNSYAWWQKFTLYEDRYTGSPGGARALGTWLRCQIWNGPFAWTKTLHATSRSLFFMYCTIVHKHLEKRCLIKKWCAIPLLLWTRCQLIFLTPDFEGHVGATNLLWTKGCVAWLCRHLVVLP